MKKIFLILLCTINVNVNAKTQIEIKAPPQHMIKSAEIRLVQGGRIYGNGKMQAVVRVKYKLSDNAKLISITLKDYGSGEELDNVGWKVTDTDNGYDHNIASNNRSEDINHKEDALSYKLKFISTLKINEWMKFCFDLTAMKDSVTETFSSCDDSGFTNGTVRIYSEVPLKLSPKNFVVLNHGYIFETYRFNENKMLLDSNGTLYSLGYRGEGIFGMSFKYLGNIPPSTDPANPKPTFDLPDTALMYRSANRKSPNSPSQVITRVISATGMTKIVTIPFLGSEFIAHFISPAKYNNGGILYLLNVTYAQFSRFKDNYRCIVKKVSGGYMLCRLALTTAYWVQDTHRKYDSTIFTPSVNSAMIYLEDNYGNVHKITLHYVNDLNEFYKLAIS